MSTDYYIYCNTDGEVWPEGHLPAYMRNGLLEVLQKDNRKRLMKIGKLALRLSHTSAEVGVK